MTLWILTGSHVEQMAHERRLPWLMGLGVCLMIVMLFVTTAGYYLTGVLPPVVAAALAFMSPCFFFIALFANAKARMDILAVAGGVLLIPFLIRYVPDYDLIIAGLVGGTGAYLAGRKFGSLS